MTERLENKINHESMEERKHEIIINDSFVTLCCFHLFAVTNRIN